MSCFLLTQKLRVIAHNQAAIRVNANALVMFRARNEKDVQAMIEENSALADAKTLRKIYDAATCKQYSFLFIDLMQADASQAFFKSFQSRLIPDKADDKTNGSSDPSPGTDLRGVPRKTKRGSNSQRGQASARDSK